MRNYSHPSQIKEKIMILDYNDYLEINDLLIQIERQVESKEVKEKIEKIGRILEKGIGE